MCRHSTASVELLFFAGKLRILCGKMRISMLSSKITFKIQYAVICSDRIKKKRLVVHDWIRRDRQAEHFFQRVEGVCQHLSLKTVQATVANGFLVATTTFSETWNFIAETSSDALEKMLSSPMNPLAIEFSISSTVAAPAFTEGSMYGAMWPTRSPESHC